MVEESLQGGGPQIEKLLCVLHGLTAQDFKLVESKARWSMP
jgi:hypothetical protein